MKKKSKNQSKPKVTIMSKKQANEMIAASKSTHADSHKFQAWLRRNYGKGLSKVVTNSIRQPNGKMKKFKYTVFNDYELSKRLVGHDAIEKVRKYVRKHIPSIQVLRCDDDVFSGSILLIIPHYKMGLTVMFIPQNTSVQNQFFLYGQDCRELIFALHKMKRHCRH